MIEFILYKIKSYTALAICSVLPSISCAAEIPEAPHLNLPPGFETTVYAKLDVLPRMMAFGPDGKLFVSSAKSDSVIMLADTDQDGAADVQTIISDKLNAPNGLAFFDGILLVANQDGIVTLTNNDGTWSKPKPLISGLATGGHTLKSVKVGPDKHLYVNVGSSCNVCNETDASRATILRYTTDGKPAGAIAVVGKHTTLPPIWASGLRNSQGFAWHPTTNEMFATNNGADMRSDKQNGPVNDELPPEHINIIKRGENYGWPHCWGNASKPDAMTTDPKFAGPAGFCQKATSPAIMLTSHSTPIGITFLSNSRFPIAYKDDAIVALHGSWNREQLSGYKLVRLIFENGKPVKAVDFATGWLNNNKAWGRPVDVAVGPDGALYVTDDRTAYIYRIVYNK